MLTEMRTLSQNWIGRSLMAVVLGFIIISFAVWGIGDRFTSFNAGALAQVGSTRITVDQYRHLYQTQLQQLEQKQKRAITNDEARRMGLDQQTLSRLVNDAVLDQEAAKLGIVVSDASVAQSIMQDDSFKGPTGKFDRGRFQALLQDNGMSETTFVRDQRGLIARRDVGEALIGGLRLPTAIETQIHRFQTEVRDFDFFVLPASAAGTIEAPSEANLKSFYDGHAGQFVAPEYRKVVVLSIIPGDLARSATIGDDEIKKRYEEQRSTRFALPEKREIQQLVFADATKAAAAKAKIDGGESFDKVAAGEKKTMSDISLGAMTKAELNDPAVAAAAFALPANGTSGPVKTQFGTVLLHVSKIDPSRQQTQAEVAGVIREDIAKDLAAKMVKKIEEQRTAGKTLTEAAASVGLKPRTIEAVDAQGRDKAHRPVEGLVEGPTLLKSVFRTDVGSDTEMIPTANGGDVWFETAGVEPSHQLPLASVKTQVEAGWRKAEIDRRLLAASDKLVKALDDGKPIEAVAAGVGKPQIMNATNVTRRGGSKLPPDAIGAVFAVAAGKAGSAADPESGRIIFKVASARVPPLDRDPALKNVLDQVKAGVENDIVSQYLTEAQREIGVGINQKALQAATGSDAGS